MEILFRIKWSLLSRSGTDLIQRRRDALKGTGVVEAGAGGRRCPAP